MSTSRRISLLSSLSALLLVLAAGVADAAPGDYKAQRFDVVARAADGGLDVTETIAFEFQSGTFKSVWREIPTSRTDGITIVGAAMDGRAMTPGDGPGHFSVTSRDGKVRVEWRFPEAGPSVRRFELRYRVRGVAYRENGADVLRWRALPAEHKYRIDASRIQFEPAGAEMTQPDARRVDTLRLTKSSETVGIEASGIGRDGWIIAELRYPAGQLAAAEPEWRQRSARARAMAPAWALGGAGFLVAGIFLVIMMRQGYSAPAPVPAEITATEPPGPLPAALASVLISKGTPSGYQSAATLLDLADRGVLRVRETPRAIGRSYELSQVPGTHDLSRHEAEALAIAFADRGDDVTLAKARGRLARQSHRFRAALNADLTARGLIDPDRKAVRDRLFRVAVGLILSAVVSAVAIAPFVPRYQGWPFLLTLGLLVAGFVGLGVAASTTALSDQGVVESARWRAFTGHLKWLASSENMGRAGVPPRWIVYAIGAGLGRQWSRYLKRHPDATPAWFDSASSDSEYAFATFVGSHTAAGADGGGGAAGGAAAAGGGGSGAG